MNESGFNKLFWGFLFIMLGFKIQGFDILPNIVGYLLFASAFSNLDSSITYFSTAAKYNIPMIVLSLFSIYERPAQGTGLQLGLLGVFTIPLAIASFVLNLLVVYNLFMGIRDMAKKREQSDLVHDSDKMWTQYLTLQIASLCSFILIFIPLFGMVYIIALLIASIIIAISILGFLKRCSDSLN
jgi:hypothetical protein